jgi:hypothetical protein
MNVESIGDGDDASVGSRAVRNNKSGFLAAENPVTSRQFSIVSVRNTSSKSTPTQTTTFGFNPHLWC